MTQITFNGVRASVKDIDLNVAEAIRYNLGLFLEEEDVEAYLTKTNLPLMVGESACHLVQFTEDELILPTGLLSQVTKKLKTLGISFNIHKQVTVAPLIQREFNPKLRPEQRQFVEYGLKYKRGIIQAPTSFGKSYSISEFLAWFDESVVRLVMVPTVNLLYQMQKDISDYLGIDSKEIGLLGDGKSSFKPITIAIPDTVASRVLTQHQETLDYLNTVSVAVFDECHRYANVTGVLAGEAMPNTEYRLGCSATPFVEVPIILEGLIGPKILEFSVEDQMRQGYIMRPKIEFHPAPPAYAPSRLLNIDFSAANWKDNKVVWSYNALYDYMIVNNKGRNELAAQLAFDFVQLNQGPILILVKKVGTSSKKENAVSHSDIIYELLKEKYGLELPIIHGKVKTKEQQRIMEQLENYEIPGAIASTGVLSEGVSIKSLAGLVMLAGGSGGPNQREIVQRIGRILRLGEGKLSPVVYDFVDPEVGGQSIFYKQSQKRFACANEVYPDCATMISKRLPNAA